MASFRYQPLANCGSIRLLKLSPCSTWTGDLRGELQHAALDEDATYEAVSYTWGGMAGTDSIVLGSASLQIPKGCSMALRRLRLRDRARLLWIDAVCIDQRNIPERNSQVEQMPKVYAHAREVVAYLGERDCSSAWLFDQVNGRGAVAVTQGDFRDATRDYRTHIESFFDRPWFSRVWVVQEVMLAKDVTLLCGRDTMSWKAFLAALNKWKVDDSLVKNISTVVRAYGSTGATLDSKLSQLSTLALLQSLRSCLASDERDKLFAVRGLIAGRSDGPDVRYDVPAETVFAAFARKHIEVTSSLDILAFAQRTQHGCSWVPDWRVPAHRSVIAEHSVAAAADGVSAGGELRSYEFVGIAQHGRFGLVVEAVQIASITDTGRDLDSPSRLRLRVRQSEQRWRLLRKPLMSRAALVKTCRRRRTNAAEDTARNDYQEPLKVEPRTPEIRPLGHGQSRIAIESLKGLKNLNHRSKALLHRRHPELFKVAERRARTARPHKPVPCFHLSGSICMHELHRIFDGDRVRQDEGLHTPESELPLPAGFSDNITEGRKLLRLGGYGNALVPEETRVGDVVCVLLGASAPFVLRPKGKHYLVTGPECQQYQIVGDCWVPGVMEGEILKVADDEENVPMGTNSPNTSFRIRSITIV